MRTLRERLESFRERLLGYDAAADKGGSIWDGLRVELDRELIAIEAHTLALLDATRC